MAFFFPKDFMHKVLSVTVAFGTALAGAMISNAQTSSTPHDHASISAPRTTLSALLTSPLGSRAAYGTAMMSGTTLQVTWVGDVPRAVRPWQLREGSCTQSGSTVGRPSLYPSLAIDVAGASAGTAKLDAPLAPDGAFVVVVYASEADSLPVMMACGALSNGVPKLRAANAAVHSTMDHSTMDHSAMSTGETPTTSDTVAGVAGVGHSRMSMSGAADTLTTTLMAIHRRMLADPVIRERVRSDPVLQRMLNDMPMEATTPADAPKPGTSKSPMNSSTTAPTKATTQPKAKPPTPKKSPANTMPGMDHSKMPGMKKPPV